MKTEEIQAFVAIPPELAGYAAQDAIKVLSENWAQSIRDGCDPLSVLHDVQDVINLLIGFQARAKSEFLNRFYRSHPPPNCPRCNGEREWNIENSAICHFCGWTKPITFEDMKAALQGRRIRAEATQPPPQEPIVDEKKFRIYLKVQRKGTVPMVEYTLVRGASGNKLSVRDIQLIQHNFKALKNAYPEAVKEILGG